MAHIKSPILPTSNRFAVLADPKALAEAEAAEAAAKAKKAARDAAKGYTLPKLDLFGTDLPKDKDGGPILRAALDKGYLAFDAAAAYDSIGKLAEVAKAQGLAAKDLFVVYKVKPEDDAALRREAAEAGDPALRRQIVQRTVAAQLAQAKTALGRQPDLLMLHELGSDAANEKTIRQFATQVKSGHAKGIGLSNVGLADLKKLHAKAKALGCPIKAVENRFSPCHRDDEVRRFCADHGIRYLAYGLMGSAQKGACHGEGYGSPTQYLLPREDPRLAALAERIGVSPGEILIKWAYAKDVVPVAFSTDERRIEANHDARTNPAITEAVLAEVDELFAKLPAAKVEALDRSSRAAPLKELYRALPDPTMWYILDELTKSAPVARLLSDTADRIATAAPTIAEREAGLTNFAKNLMRHVADMQSAGTKDWAGWITMQLGEVAGATGARPEVADRFLAWATKNSELGGGFTQAAMVLADMLAESLAPGQRAVDLSSGWSCFTDDSCTTPVASPVAGGTYAFYKNGSDGFELLTAKVDAKNGTKLVITPEE